MHRGSPNHKSLLGSVETASPFSHTIRYLCVHRFVAIFKYIHIYICKCIHIFIRIYMAVSVFDHCFPVNTTHRNKYKTCPWNTYINLVMHNNFPQNIVQAMSGIQHALHQTLCLGYRSQIRRHEMMLSGT